MDYVVDTSAVIEKVVSRLIKEDKLKGSVLIPNAVVAELENQANYGHEIGFVGLEELQEIQELVKKDKIKMEFIGKRPTESQIKFAKSGEIDALIRELAFSKNATLITADRVQAASAKVYGINVHFLEKKKLRERLEIERFFDPITMSIHLKENCVPRAKKGKPGDWKLVEIKKRKLDSRRIQSMAKEIVEKARIDPSSFIEISRRGSTIVQYRDYRIIIVKPPVSDGWEITVVRPIKKLQIKDYKIPDEIFSRIAKKAAGIIIAGETGSGKSTFAESLAEFHSLNHKIVKTIESPRDLRLIDEITQYSKNFASNEEIHDILFLSRPDYIIFDEMRTTPDFNLYVDLRLAGSSVVGVLHSASPIDAVQRFITRIDTGMIPSIVDTILFIEAGAISRILTLNMIVKVPSGMTEADLARPVVEVFDFFNNKLLYEIYSYGEETVVVPVQQTETAVTILAQKQLEGEIKKYCREAKIELISNDRAIVYVPEREIPRIIGKQGKRIESIEKSIGIKITVKELRRPTKFDVSENPNYIVLHVNKGLTNKSLNISIENEFLTSAIVGNKGEIRINKRSEIGKTLLNALDHKERITLE